ncbi:MAG: Ig-like domain-containing protein [Bacillota bacterium]|nr:Ig-like domain-containing protein [Bacillota bacterium]
MKKLVSCVLTLALLAGLMVHFQPSYADPANIPVNISDVTLVRNSDGKIPENGFANYDVIRMALKWDATAQGNTLKENDYFDVDLPPELLFPKQSSARSFDLYAPDGVSVMAKCVVTDKTPATDGSTVRVTFTNWVEGKFDVKGTMNFSVTFNKQPNGVEKDIIFKIGTFEYKYHLKIREVVRKLLKENGAHQLEKWPHSTLSDDGHVRWFMRINNEKKSYNDLEISDVLTSKDGNMDGIEFVKDTFILQEVQEDEYGSLIPGVAPIVTKIGDQVVFSENNSKFTYKLGKVDGKQYRLYYNSTFRPGVKLENKATMAGYPIEPGTGTPGAATSVTKYSSAVFASSGGTGEGTLASKIQILKQDALDNSPLQGAEFEVTKLDDNSTFKITSDEKGQALSDKLKPGKYKVVETKAPAGYVLQSQEIELDVKADAPATHTFKNEPEKTTVTVKKEWVGAPADEVEVALKADDAEVQTFKLTAADGWTKTVSELRKYKKGTEEEIKYTAEEKNLAGYTAEYSVDTTGILVIKNTQKVNVPVKKVWEMLPGNAAPVESIEVELLKDALATGQKLELKSADAWQNEFKDLAMESATTAFSVKEVGEADGKLKIGEKIFEVKYDGDMKAGYTVTNKELPAPTPDSGDNDKTRDSTTSIVTTPKEDGSSSSPKPKEDVTDLKDGSVPKTDIPNTDKPGDTSATEQPKQDPTQELNADGTPKGNTTPENNTSTPKTNTDSAVTAKKLPQTGDGVDPMVYAGLAFLMGSALIAFGIRRKMKDEK